MEKPGFPEEVMDAMPGAMLVFDPDFNVVWRNRAAKALAPGVAPGVNLYDALGPCANEEKIDRMLLRTEKVACPAQPDGAPLEWLVHREPLSNGDRILMAWEPTLTDEMVERRTTFSMAAAHELKSPLTALIGFTEILEMERSNLTPLQEEATEMILKNALYLKSLVDDILDLTSNSFGELKLELGPTDIADTVTQVTDSLLPKIEEGGQTLIVEIEPDMPVVEADGRRIRQVVQNLVQNAHVHTGPGTTITVTAATREDGGVVVSVADDGPGLPFEHPEDAFASFRHAGTVSLDDVTGSGIGLTVAKRMTELHRGRIAVESENGEGTKFEVWLPIDRSNTFTRTPPGPA